jgi:hypothetical protein
MPNVTVLHQGSANGQEANWIPTIAGNDGLSVQNSDADYVASGNNGLGNPKNPFDLWNDVSAHTPLWIDDGTLTAPGVTITSVTLHIIHGNFDATNDLDVWVGFSGGGGQIGPTYGYDEGDLGGYSLLLHTAGGPYVSHSHLFLINPVTGVAWTANDLFLAASGGAIQSFFFDKFRDGAAYPNYSNYRINQIYLDVSYTTSGGTPTSVSVVGTGGVKVSNPVGVGTSIIPALAFGVSAGTPPELHLNQWGLQSFSLQTDLEEHF